MLNLSILLNVFSFRPYLSLSLLSLSVNSLKFVVQPSQQVESALGCRAYSTIKTRPQGQQVHAVPKSYGNGDRQRLETKPPPSYNHRQQTWNYQSEYFHFD